MSLDSTTKRCSRCTEFKTLDLFPKNRAHKDGYANYCTACQSAYAAAYRVRKGDQMRQREKNRYAQNGEAMRAYQAAYRDQHPEAVAKSRQKSAAWYRANRDRAYASARANRMRNHDRVRVYDREWKRAYRAANPEKHKAYMQAYNDQNREKVRAWAREYRRTHMDTLRQAWRLKRAKRRGAMKGMLVDYNIIWQRDGGICHICNDFVAPDDVHFDHVIPLSKGGPHTYENIKVSHSTCNLRKKAKLL